ncbi:hypothetical protein [Nocardioides sp. 1609]|uniref:hypothetical protein n=1 Tax=Nocardioides sp. 1609 TaxID=2508327 RepID=UPI00106F7EAD|nr:hypothetical protein [Nocardioides sp. 1609]
MTLLHRAVSGAAATALVVAGLALAPAHAAPSNADPGFGTHGRVLLQSPTSESLADVLTLPDDRVLAVSNVPGSGNGLLLRRLRANGAPDPTFGTGGAQRFGPAGYYGQALLAYDAPRGLVYLTTFQDNGTTAPTDLWRFRADGTQDLGFGGGDGRITIEHRLTEGLAVQPDGKVLLAGVSFLDGKSDVLRLLPDGVADTGFGVSGRRVLTSGSEAGQVVVQPDGRILVAGSTTSTVLVHRLRADGAPDPTWSGDGSTTYAPSTPGWDTTTVWPPGIAVRPDGSVVVAAGLNQVNATGLRTPLLVAQLTRRGTTDSSFASRVVPQFMSYTGSVALQRNGRLAVAGQVGASPNGVGAVLRLTTRGGVDLSFGTKGVWTGTGLPELTDLVLQSSGRLVAGTSTDETVSKGVLVALRGDRVPTCGGRLATQFGGPRKDRLVGTSGRDVLVGSRGADVLLGRGGDDWLCGAQGKDALQGGSGNDHLVGGAGKDRLRGGTGVDQLVP